MWDFLKRQKLQRKGYSCGKKRREQNRSEWVEALSGSPYVRALIVAAFVCAMGMMVRMLDGSSVFWNLGDGPLIGIGCLGTIILMAVAHLRIYLSPCYASNGRFLLTFLALLLQLTLLQGTAFLVRLNQFPESSVIYFAPLALAPMVLTLLLGPPHGLFAVIYGSLLGTLLTHADLGLKFTIVSAASGWAAVRATQSLRKRGSLMRAGFYAGLAGVAACALLGQMEPVWHSPGSLASWKKLATEAPTMLLAGILTATIAGSLLPLLEGLFRITTTVSWLELGDLNHPLLRRMTLEAPGTWHHSLMVANLAEAAAIDVGANPTICRVCSLFHDVGKLNKPEYYIENTNGIENPHNDLTPSMSALVVISHVKDGVDLALKHKLNPKIIEVIQQHHGNSLIVYFHRRALDQQEEIKKLVAEGKVPEEDIPEVSEASFRYPGPKPDFRESAIISLADAVESASRSLSKPTPSRIEALVDEIIRARARDGQLDECDLTMSELKTVRDSFSKTLRTALHRRIPYPGEKEKETRLKDETRAGRIESAADRPRPVQRPATTVIARQQAG
ncbi:MAG: HDIG domain-containing metalloprotein [Verrucomicrobiota bacterium]